MIIQETIPPPKKKKEKERKEKRRNETKAYILKILNA